MEEKKTVEEQKAYLIGMAIGNRLANTYCKANKFVKQNKIEIIIGAIAGALFGTIL